MSIKLKDYEPSFFEPTNFQAIAKTILSGAFRITSLSRTVYVVPTCIEFYYHDEIESEKVPVDAIIGASDSEYAACDPIVYHRNDAAHPNRPLFPIGTLHNHVSGIDITFERGASSSSAVRVSVLIREFKMFGESDEIRDVLEYKEDDFGSETRSTYLYGALFSQFSIFDGFEVKWVDGIVAAVEIAVALRKNVCQFKKTGNMKYQKLEKQEDVRLWQFKNVASTVRIQPKK